MTQDTANRILRELHDIAFMPMPVAFHINGKKVLLSYGTVAEEDVVVMAPTPHPVNFVFPSDTAIQPPEPSILDITRQMLGR